MPRLASRRTISSQPLPPLPEKSPAEKTSSPATLSLVDVTEPR